MAKKASPAQLAARAKFAKMIKSKSKKGSANTSTTPKVNTSKGK